jgi:thioredoxin-like negative regulator of GroEL
MRRVHRGVIRRWAVGLTLSVSLLGASACGEDTKQSVDVAVAMSEGVEAHAQGRSDDAEARFDEVIEASPGNRVALYNLGILRRARGEVAGALDAFSQLVDADPNFTAARLQRAITRQSAGDLAGAIADLRIVVEQEPGNLDARRQLGALLVATGEDEEGEALLAD